MFCFLTLVVTEQQMRDIVREHRDPQGSQRLINDQSCRPVSRGTLARQPPHYTAIVTLAPETPNACARFLVMVQSNDKTPVEIRDIQASI